MKPVEGEKDASHDVKSADAQALSKETGSAQAGGTSDKLDVGDQDSATAKAEHPPVALGAADLSFEFKVNPSKRTASDHRQVKDDCVVGALEAEGDAATSPVFDCEYEDIPPAAKLPAVYEPPPAIPLVTEPEAALDPEQPADEELKLFVSAALRRETPLKAERRYIAEFTLDRNGVGIITALRVAGARFEIVTRPIRRAKS